MKLGSKQKSRNELEYLNNVQLEQLDETFANSLPSKTFTAYDVDFLVFNGTALSTITKANRSPILANLKP